MGATSEKEKLWNALRDAFLAAAAHRCKTQTAAAKALGISRQAYNRYKQGVGYPKQEVVLRAGEVFGFREFDYGGKKWQIARFLGEAGEPAKQIPFQFLPPRLEPGRLTVTIEGQQRLTLELTLKSS